MPSKVLRTPPSITRTLGSLWFGAVLLVMLLATMAGATVYESSYGTERALFEFYQSWWFKLLLGLLAVNVAVAAILRYPYSRRHIGFLTTHGSILAILSGALVTHYFGIEGQLSLGEGERVKEFTVPIDTLTLLNRTQQTSAVVELTSRGFRGWEPVDHPYAPALHFDGVAVKIERYLPDAVRGEKVVNDNPQARMAVEVSFSNSVGSEPIWIFENQTVLLSGEPTSFRVVQTEDELQSPLSHSNARVSTSQGTIRVELAGTSMEIPLEQGMAEPVRIGDSAVTIQVLRYLPHATVGPDNKLVNLSDQPTNPAIEAEIVGPSGVEKRITFARYPDFRSMHGSEAEEELKVKFSASTTTSPAAPVEILATPEGGLFARFSQPDDLSVNHPMTIGSPLEVPAGGKKLTIHRLFNRARIERTYEPVAEARESKAPAILVQVSSPSAASKLWLEKYRPLPLTIDGALLELSFGSKVIPLGFELALNRFTVGRYPGENRPRSFESQVTITDAPRGRVQTRVISMNHPTAYGGFTLFQSSYHIDGTKATSVLSVSYDPGRPIVFVGYIALLTGMLTVLGMRIADQRRLTGAASLPSKSGNGRTFDLLRVSERCLSSQHGPLTEPTQGKAHPGFTRGKKGNPSRLNVGVSNPALLLCAAMTILNPLPIAAAPLPNSLDLKVIRELPVQHDGRWPPLDTVARDVIRSVAGKSAVEVQDPVLLLLAWTFDPQTWMDQPLIRISNAELRAELQLSPTQIVYSYNELANHPQLRSLVTELATLGRGRKLDPLQSKVSDIHEKLLHVQSAFAGNVIRPIPEPKDIAGAWLPIGPPRDGDSAQIKAVKMSWNRLREAFLSDNAAAFIETSSRLSEELAVLPAAYRPDARRTATELRYNRLQPFSLAWVLMLGAAVIASAALAVRRRWFDALTFVAVLAGFGAITYGLTLRWQIAERIPASNMYESLLFLGWGAAAFAMISVFLFRQRLVPLTAAGMSAAALFLADRLPVDPFIRPIAPVLQDTVWMSIHVPIIMVSYSVLALAVLIAHVQIVAMAAAPQKRAWIESLDRLHCWYVQVGSLLLAAGIITGSMWAASSWGRYWGWDPKEVWSLIALLGYLTILHVRINQERVPRWVYAAGAIMMAVLCIVLVAKLSPITGGKAMGLTAMAFAMVLLVATRGPFATASKSILCFWLIIMTYVGVNYVLSAGLHSYGFGTGAVARSMLLTGGADVVIVALCWLVYVLRWALQRGAVVPRFVAAIG